MYAYETHAYEVHAYDMHVYNMDSSNIHALRDARPVRCIPARYVDD